MVRAYWIKSTLKAKSFHLNCTDLTAYRCSPGYLMSKIYGCWAIGTCLR
jgi:hypothetical protein